MDSRAGKTGRLLRNFIAVGAGNYGAMALNLAITAALTRRLGVDEWGHYGLLFMASSVLANLTINWTQGALVRFGSVEHDEKGSIAEAFWTRVWIVAPWALGASGVIAVFQKPLADYLNVPAWALWLVGAHTFATFLISLSGAAFQAMHQMRRYGTALFLDKAVMGVAVLALPISWIHDPRMVLSMYAASSAVVALGSFAVLGLRPITPVRVHRDAYRTMFRYAFPLTLSTWAGLFGTGWFDLAIINKYLPISSVGLYFFAMAVAGVIQQITVVFSSLLLPQLSVMAAKNERHHLEEFVDRFLPYWFLATSVLFCIVVFTMQPLIPLVFKPDYLAAVPVLVLLVLATCALVVTNVCSPLLAAFGSTWAITTVCLVSGSVNVVLDLALIPRFGLMGSAAATLVAYTTSAVMALAFVRRSVPGRVFALGWLAVPVAVACLCYFLLPTLGFYVFGIPASAAAAYWLVARFRLFRAEDAVFLKDIRLPASLGRAQ